MVQILNKMVHLKYPTYYPIASFKAEIWHKFEESVSKQSGSIALHKSFSQGKYGTQFCLFVLANQTQASKLRFSATFGTCCSSQMPSSRLKCGKKLRNMSPSRFVICLSDKIRSVLYVNLECLFWPIKCMHSKPRFWVHFGHCFAS